MVIDDVPGGGIRESQGDRPRFDLLLPLGVPHDDQFLTRIALYYARSIRPIGKYPERNWEQFNGQAALDRAKASAARHFMAWMAGETDEDHAAAVFANLQFAEHIKWKMRTQNDG
jgi:hypothetical protein